METHSNILDWGILWTEEPGGLQSMGSQRVRHDLVTKQQLPFNNIFSSKLCKIFQSTAMFIFFRE